jgi:hypothetical protein
MLWQLICPALAGSMTEQQPLAIVRTTDDLREVFRRRVAELNISLDTLDEIAGLPTRYSAKVFGLQRSKNFGQMSLEALLGALGLMLPGRRGRRSTGPRPKPFRSAATHR